MDKETKKKRLCEVCKKKIPDDFGNALCIECYNKQVKEIEDKKTQEAEERKAMGKESPNDSKPPETPLKEPTGYNKNGVTDPKYIENPEKEVHQWEANIMQFERSGRLLWDETRSMYTYIKNYFMRKVLEHPQYPKFIWKPKVVDVGCGAGVGSNVLSIEADFVWGIDKHERSIMFAKEAFTREKNGVYYSPQVTFDVVDIATDNREFMKFDFVVCIEVIEHVDDYKSLLKNIIRFAKKDKKGGYNVNGFPTEFFISTPNRNAKKISKVNPGNKFHVREWTSEEFHAVLSEFFNKVEFFNREGKPAEIKNDWSTVLAKCSLPKI